MKNRKKNFKEIGGWLVTILAAFILAFLFSSKAYANVEVHQSSMENTIYNSQHLIVDEISYHFHHPVRGDIITFYKNEKKGSVLKDFTRYIDNIVFRITNPGEINEKHERLIKRVIGIEGDTIDIKDGCVYVNNKKLYEPYEKGKTLPKGLKTPVTVGKNELFVLGDNRSVSIDSREIGLVRLDQVEGKAIFRIYPFDKFKKLE